MKKIQIGIVGGAGYWWRAIKTFIQHEKVKISYVTSRKFVGKSIFKRHPNLRGFTDLKFISPNDIFNVDVIFLVFTTFW